ncbi:SMI1/KNR4 family protein [Massilia sp. CCM 8733]|uniref:SMI1/KNR4 family protein n=1 Tax=Massilia mucilaginosa TaxID=2609282 RepID=A0ABX0P3R8_9BURK|nr:SMI1/KNR4 family protein [Massilia mucilaginosa]NHZ93963.1 SMI1/KNR4 family protein [Massilia mucilaginosa]
MTPSLIPQQVIGSLYEKKYFRQDKDLVDQALNRLMADHPLFRSFFETYEGSFWSEHLGYELLDIVDGSETVETSTGVCRNKFGFPPQFLVLTQLSTGQVVVLNVHTDKVYEVDFEGGEKLLLSGELPPRWTSFDEFLKDYFKV